MGAVGQQAIKMEKQKLDIMKESVDAQLGVPEGADRKTAGHLR